MPLFDLWDHQQQQPNNRNGSLLLNGQLSSEGAFLLSGSDSRLATVRLETICHIFEKLIEFFDSFGRLTKFCAVLTRISFGENVSGKSLRLRGELAGRRDSSVFPLLCKSWFFFSKLLLKGLPDQACDIGKILNAFQAHFNTAVAPATQICDVSTDPP